MARGTRLLELRQMLKAELRLAPQGAGSADLNFNRLLWHVCDQLATENDWDFLITKADVSCSSRYNTLPTTLNFNRPVKVEAQWLTKWQTLCAGIGAKEYNAVEEGDAQDPIWRWAYYDSDQFEVWPVPVEPQTVRFTGQKKLTAWTDSNGNFLEAATCELDDLLVVLLAAAEAKVRDKAPDAAATAELAKRRFITLRSNANTPRRRLVLSVGPEDEIPRVYPIRVLTQA